MGNSISNQFRNNSRTVANLTIDDELDFDINTVFELQTLNTEEKDVFDKYLTSRPLDQWRYTDMPMLVQAVKISMRINRVFDRIEAEGYMLPGSTGETLVANPLFRIYTTLMGTYGTLMTRLQLTPDARGESTTNIPKARLIEGKDTSHLIPRDIDG